MKIKDVLVLINLCSMDALLQDQQSRSTMLFKGSIFISTFFFLNFHILLLLRPVGTAGPRRVFGRVNLRYGLPHCVELPTESSTSRGNPISISLSSSCFILDDQQPTNCTRRVNTTQRSLPTAPPLSEPYPALSADIQTDWTAYQFLIIQIQILVHYQKRRLTK